MKRSRVLIVGGGFAGLACALALDARRFAVTVVDARRHFEFIPNIHELISGVKRAGDLRLPLGSLLRDRGHRYALGEVIAVDQETRSVNLADGRSLEADFLVIATGSADADYGISGVHRHALPLKSVADGQAIAARLKKLRRGAQPARIVVVGGGLAGIEALGEVLRHCDAQLPEVHLVEAQERLLPGGPVNASRYLARECAKLGVTLHLGDPVARITAKTVTLESGQRLRSDATIWTGGPAPPPVLATSGIGAEAGWVAVEADLRVPGHPGVFVAGDSAQPPRPLSRQAYFALDMGAAVADNIERLSRGRRTRRFRALPRPTLLAFGEQSCVLVAGRTAIAGKPLMALKEGIYAAVMAQLDRRQVRRRLPALLQRSRGSSTLLWPLLEPRALLGTDGRVRRLR